MDFYARFEKAIAWALRKLEEAGYYGRLDFVIRTMIVALFDSLTFKNDGEGYSVSQKKAEIKGASRCRLAPNRFAIALGLWQYDAVDDVDDAVGCIKISGCDMRHAAFGVRQHDGLAH